MRAVSSLTAVAVAAAGAGCSFGVNRAPTTVTAEAEPRCTESMTLPGLDFVVAGAAGLGGLAAGEDGAVLLGTGAFFGLMGLLGQSWVKHCRRKKAQYARLTGGANGVIVKTESATPELGPGLDVSLAATTATDAATPAPAEDASDAPANEVTGDVSDAAPEDPYAGANADSARPAASAAAVAARIARPPASSCPKGTSCPRGLKCDPLRHRCVGDAEIGTEDQRCGRDGRCDAGLYCDLDRRVCLPGNLGLEGGACQAGGRCAAGLACHAGLCVRPAVRRSTSSGSTRRKTATRPTRGAAPERPGRP